jgi:hypothetical protein
MDKSDVGSLVRITLLAVEQPPLGTLNADGIVAVLLAFITVRVMVGIVPA